VLSIEILNCEDWAYVLAANFATTLDSDTHALVSTAEPCILVLGDGFLPPKSKPIIVKSDEDVDGMIFDAIGESFGGIKDDKLAKLYDKRPRKSCLRR
jgi:hypothetical protein